MLAAIAEMNRAVRNLDRAIHGMASEIELLEGRIRQLERGAVH